MFTNLIVLPALLLIFDSGKRSKLSHPLIEQYEELYDEENDEEIDIGLIQLNHPEEKSEDSTKTTLDSK